MSNFTDEYWLSVFDDCKKSGLSQRLYCAKNEITLSTFRYYYNKLVRKVVSKPQETHHAKPLSFEPVIISDNKPATKSTIALTFNLPNQISFKIETELSQLATIIKEVKGLC